MRLRVRPAAREDEAEVVALWRACNLLIDGADPRRRFSLRARTASEVLVGENEAGRISAGVMVGHDGHRGWLYYVACSPDLRRRGIGRQMIGAATDWLRQRGVVKAQLLVREANAGVVTFYERLGFERTPRIVMSKWLTPLHPASSSGTTDPAAF
jgi:ribosomal protein S18 acetylase RimI-like enzyme